MQNFKKELLGEYTAALTEVKAMKKEADYIKSQANHLQRMEAHRGSGGLFDMLGDFMDTFRIAIYAIKDEIKLKEVGTLNDNAEVVMNRVENYKKEIQEKIFNQEPSDNVEKTIMEDFLGAEDDNDMLNFIHEHQDSINSKRESDAFIFDEALEDFEETSAYLEEEYKDYFDEELEASKEEEGMMQR